MRLSILINTYYNLYLDVSVQNDNILAFHRLKSILIKFSTILPGDKVLCV